MKGTANIQIVPVVVALLALPAVFSTALVTGRAQAQATDASGGSATTEPAEGEAAAGDAPAADAPADDDGDTAASSDDATIEPSDSASGLSSGSGGESDGDGTHAGGGEAGSDEEEIDRSRSEAEAEEAQANIEPLAWRNTFFSWTMGSTFNTFYRGADLSYNPLYYWSFFLTPRWYFSSNVFLVVNQGLYYEFTDDDGANYNHEPQLYDTTVELRATFVADRFIFIPAIRLTLPVSKLSQASQRYFNTGIGLTAVANLPEVANGNLALSLAYRRWWGSSNVSRTLGPTPVSTTDETGTIGGFGPNGAAGAAGIDSFGDGQADGTTLGVDRLLLGLTWNLTPVEGLTVTLSGFLLWDQGYTLATPALGVMGNPMLGDLEDTRSHWRMFSSYTAQIAYDVQPWFNLGVGVSNATNLSPFWASDGSVLSPFNPNTQVFLSGTVTLDGIYETITAGGEDDGLTPEERQRRRQGLAAIDEELLEEVLDETPLRGASEGDDAAEEAADEGTGAARATGTF